MILLAALAGAAIAGGLVLGAWGLLGRSRAPGTPPGRASGLTLSAAERRRVLFAVLAGLAVYLLTRWPVAALAAAAGVVFLPKLSMGGSQRSRTAMLEGLEQWIRRLADMVTASRGLEDAVSASARSAPPAVAGPVGALADRLAARMGAEAALRAFAAEIDDPAGDRIAAALIIATGRRGGGARDVLVTLAELLSADVAGRREIDADRAEHRTTVKWIAAFIGGFSIFAIINRSYSAPFGTFAGQVVLALVALLYAGALAWLRRLGSIPAAGRFLDDTAADQPAPGAARAELPAASPAESGRPW
ncbi:MAG TPA: type II secretion system F family protein [Streptosporangiaceae bacterium]|jgi:Flp pilus assembly protein TadB